MIDEFCESCILKMITDEEFKISELQNQMNSLTSTIVKMEVELRKMDDRIVNGESHENLLLRQKRTGQEIDELETKENE